MTGARGAARRRTGRPGARRAGRSAERPIVVGVCFTGHGASVAVVSGGRRVRALSLERFTGEKDALMFGRRELDGILARGSAVEAAIHASLSIGYGEFPPVFVFEETFAALVERAMRDLPFGPGDVDLVVGSDGFFTVNRWWPENFRRLQDLFPAARIDLQPEHHQVHRFQAFLGSPFDDAAVLTVDTCGEPLARHGGAKLAMTLAHAESADGAPARYEVFEEHAFPASSPGRIYSIVTHALGFRQGQEGKTMGLAPYGGEGIYRDLALNLRLRDDGSFRFLSDRALGRELERYAPPRRPDEPIRQVHADIARFGQRVIEEVLLNAVRCLARRSPSSNLAVAGGVGLNSVANEKLLSGTRFERLYVMPNCGDPGQALGCALHGYDRLAGCRLPGGVVHDYLGPTYRDDEIDAALAGAGLEARRPRRLAGEVARRLARGEIVGWFQGGSEFGPRALGNRSILADPRPAAMKDHLNARVKHREAFRPFAPAVLEEEATAWFRIEGTSPFMLRVVEVRSEKRVRIAAVTHVDDSARVQTVSRATNEPFHRLISAFGRLTGVPMVLNTSFNVNGKPIVETPADAVACFLGTGIDVLVLHDRIVDKGSGPPE